MDKSFKEDLIRRCAVALGIPNFERKNMITPTVGRVVHYFAHSGSDPQCALIVHVWGSRCVNLAVFDHNGKIEEEPTTSITLVQPEDDRPEMGCYCEWLPYQVKKPTGSESGEREAGTQEI